MSSHLITELGPVVALVGSIPLAIIACLATGFLVGAVGALLGIGGGFLITPLLHSGVGLTAAHAVATSMGQLPLMALSGVVHFARQKKIDYRLGLALSSTSIPTAQVAAYLMTLVASSPHGQEPLLWGSLTAVDLELMVAFSVLIGGLGIYNLRRAAAFSGPPRATERRRLTHRQAAAASMAVGTVFGASAALLGIGGGFVAVPFFVHVCGLPPIDAVATSLFAVLATSTLTTVQYVAAGQTQLLISLLLGLGAVFGAQVGARLAIGASGRQLVVGMGALQIAAVVVYAASKLVAGAVP